MEASILVGVVVLAGLLVAAIVLNLELFLTVIILLALLAMVAVVILGLIGLIAAVPFYLVKGGRGPEPGAYSIGEVRAVKEDERK